MTVNEFMSRFKDDIPKTNTFESYIEYKKWQPDFFAKTSPFHESVKKSFFEQTSQIIESSNYSLYKGNLVEFAYLGLFDENDELEFSKLINKIALKLDENGDETEKLLGFIESFMDFILHEYYPEAELKKSIKALKNKIIENKELDNECTFQILHFIGLMNL